MHIARSLAGHQPGEVLDRAGRRNVSDASLLLPGLRGEGVDNGIVIASLARRQNTHPQMCEVGRPVDEEGQEAEQHKEAAQHGQLQGCGSCKGALRQPEHPLEPFFQPGRHHGAVVLRGRSSLWSPVAVHGYYLQSNLTNIPTPAASINDCGGLARLLR